MKKKQILTVLLLAALCLSLCGCKAIGALYGDVSSVVRQVGNPTAHSEEAINAAMDAVIKEFRKNYGGCTLDTLWYDAVLESKETKPTDADEMILLACEFHTGDYGPNVLQSLSPNEHHTGYKWMLCRYGDRWEIKGRGYA